MTAGTHRRRGRPPKLTPATLTAIISSVQAGSNIGTAARSAGIHPATLRRWAAKENQNDDPDAESGVLRAALASARAENARKSVTREPVTDGNGTEIGVRTTRRLRNGTVEITEDFTRPGGRAMRDRLRHGAAARPGSLEALFGFGGAA